jgi:hypothetical protein
MKWKSAGTVGETPQCEVPNPRIGVCDLGKLVGKSYNLQGNEFNAEKIILVPRNWISIYPVWGHLGERYLRDV